MKTHIAEHRPSESLSPLIPSTVQFGLTSAPALEDDPTTPERAPVRLGHYVLLQRIGQGGMGVSMPPTTSVSIARSRSSCCVGAGRRGRGSG